RRDLHSFPTRRSSDLEELVDEFPAGVEGVVVAAFGDGGLAAGEEHAAFDLHEGGGHDEELAGDVEVELLERVEHVDVLAGDRFDGDVVDIQLVLFDEKEEEVEQALKDRQLDAIIGVGNHGREMDGGARGRAMPN